MNTRGKSLVTTHVRDRSAVTPPMRRREMVRHERLHHYFQATCDDSPDSIAVEVEGVALSYGQLDTQANQLAHHLLAIGIEPGSRIAILMQRSVEVYTSLLGVLKAGCAFVPIDPSSPADRVEYITTDSDVDLVLTSAGLTDLAGSASCPVVALEELGPQLAALPKTRPELPVFGDPTAYIIYTSGSSGRPKGVEVAQSSICNFISVVPPLYRVTASDRVYQGMTIAFDFSIEEIWPTWAVGATVVAGPTDGRRLGSDLADFLDEQRITVLYCVPTVLATVDRDLPLLHTLNVGGEACPQELVERWCTGGRVMLNTYGPTETTVTCTMAELEPGRPVTIGYPLPTYEAYLLDDHLRPVADGEVGEICIGGPGVAVGYVGRADLTAEKFIPNPYTEGDRLYRTGDLGRWTTHGIEYQGRADSEVKVRGHRIDLQEIENVLRLDDGVADAVATVHRGTNELAAFVTLRAPERDDELIRRLHQRLQETVPGYMVPAYLSALDSFPMLPSGKVDRKALPDPQGARLVADTGPHVAPSTPLEHELCEVWSAALGLEAGQVSIDADFFTDLGGHSLAAALVVSDLRRRGSAAPIAIGDLYANPTVRALALHLSGGAPAGPPQEAVTPRRHATNRVVLAGAGQLAMLYGLLLVFSLPVALIYNAHGGQPSLTMVVQLLTLFPIVYLLGRWILPVVGVRLLSRRVRSGTYPLWGSVHLRVWAIQKLMSISPTNVLAGSPLLNPYLRLLGARVGPACHLATGQVELPHLADIGDGVSVGHGAALRATHVEAGYLTVGAVRLAPGSFVGSSTMVLPGSEVGAGAALAEHSALGPHEALPDGERWVGSPSKPASEVDPVFEAMADSPSPRRNWTGPLLGGFAAGTVVLELLPLVAAAPGIALVWWVLLEHGVWPGLAATALIGPVFVVLLCLAIAGLRVLVLPRTPTGILSLRSELGLRKWFVDKLLESSLAMTNSLYATLYTVPWLRLLGARIGPGCEVSTVASVSPDLLRIEAQSFIADMAQVSSATHHNGHVAVATTEIGRRAFVGNASFIPAGTTLGDDSLVGVHTVPPRYGVPAETSWLGSPAIFLPRRQESACFAEELTFRPGRRRQVERLAIELVRVTLPGSLLAAGIYMALLVISAVALRSNPVVVALAAPAAFLAAGLACVLVVAGAKWLLVGGYRPQVEPLWSRFVRRSELATGLYEAAAVPALLQALTGTPLLGPLLRLFGARIGRRTFIDTTHLTEFDLVSIGDDAAIGAGASLQTHLFEDRVMKMSELTVEPGASVGARSVVLYDAVVAERCAVGSLSLVMKGEELVPATRWAGIPAQPRPGTFRTDPDGPDGMLDAPGQMTGNGREASSRWL
jgi:non-ribosomal peptide synthetase-like protein